MPTERETEVRDAAVRHQVFIERYKAGEVEEAEENSTLIEEAALLLLLSLRFPNARDLKKNELDSVVREMASRIGGLSQEYQRSLMGRLQDLADYESGFEARTISRIIGDTIGEPRNAWNLALGQNMGHNGETVREFLDRWNESEVRAFQNAVRKAWLDGTSIEAAIVGTKENAFKDGVLNRINNWRKTNVNTLIQHVSMTSKLAAWEEMEGEVKYRWISILDSRTTDICRGRSNRVYVAGVGPIPPAHENCRSVISFIPNQ